MVRAIVVEDDEIVLSWVAKLLTAEGFRVSPVPTGHLAMDLLAESVFELAIIDLELPDMSGNDIVRYARENARATSIIVLSGHTHDSEVIGGLDAGADDYVAKPVASSVLSARIRAVLRRHAMPDQVQVADIRLDRLTRKLVGESGDVSLTAKEYDLLAMLMAHHGQVVSRNTLLLDLWGYDFDPGTSMLDVALTRVRQKVKSVSSQVQVRSVRNMGVILEIT